MSWLPRSMPMPQGVVSLTCRGMRCVLPLQMIPCHAAREEFDLEHMVLATLAACTELQAMHEVQVAMGFIKIANATMCRPIQALTQMRGYDVAQHVLACFGGAGGQHACAIARSLGMRTIFVHHYSGILSAVGIGLADVVMEEQVCRHQQCRQLPPKTCIVRLNAQAVPVGVEMLGVLQTQRK